jgi:hypothetical protein
MQGVMKFHSKVHIFLHTLRLNVLHSSNNIHFVGYYHILENAYNALVLMTFTTSRLSMNTDTSVFVGFQALAAVVMESPILWKITPCSLLRR